jgi:phosphohistidine swiveling domain-containing protein
MTSTITWKQFANKQGCVLSRDVVTSRVAGHYLDQIFGESEPFMKFYKYVDFTHYMGGEDDKAFERTCDRSKKCILAYGKDDYFKFTKILSDVWVNFSEMVYNKVKDKKLSREELHALFLKFIEEYSQKISLVVFNYYYIESLTREIKEKLSNYNHDVENDFLVLCTSYEENKIQLMKEHILELAVKILANEQKNLFDCSWEEFLEKVPENVMQKVKEITKKYSWTKIMYLVGGVLEEKDVFESLKLNLEKNPSEQLVNLRKEKENVDIAYKKKLEELKLDNYLIYLIELLREASGIRTREVEDMMYGEHNCYYLLKSIGEFMGLEYQDLTCLTIAEVIRELNGSELKRKIRQRKGGFAYVKENQKVQLFDTPEGLDSVREKIDEEIKEFSGMVAFQGKVRGKVKVINRSDELNNFEKGDILVTPMTTPDFVMAMEKALAIITNDGGITCHAAIISRELRVPCIVGTQIATKVLKDGDLVEVDAEKGIIRKV